MIEIFLKKYWNEENILFYLHFQNGRAVRQIEINLSEKVLLSSESPNQGESFLYDQSLDELDIDESNFITKEEFDKVWYNE